MENEKEQQIKYDGKFIKDGKITSWLREDMCATLDSLEQIVGTILKAKPDKIPSSFGVRDVYVVGSALKGSSKSDIDIYLRTEGTDQGTNDILKKYMFFALCEGKNKNDWVDTYFGAELPSIGCFEGKPNFKITDQIEPELKKYNKNIGAPNIKLGH